MLAKRIIPCLDVKEGRVVKGISFVNLRDAGDPVEAARLYNDEGADEICFLDITASSEKRAILIDVVRKTAEQVFMPLTVGGGVRTLDDIRTLLNAGADKVSINTAAVQNPEFVREASERFGLSQLHQLRGRVGRGDHQSYCLLFTESQNPMTQRRLKAMETSNIGAELAELDLKLRGPGDMFGTAQHGLPKLKIASFSDFDLIERVRKEAENIFPHLQKYPELEKMLTEDENANVPPD